MRDILTRILLCSVCLVLVWGGSARAETLRISSRPAGATVDIDGVPVGTTPYEIKVPRGYVHKTHTVFSGKLEHPMVLRLSKPGYASKEIVMTEGPMHWLDLNGGYHGDYWLLKTNHFDFVLDPVAKSLTGAVGATMAGNSKIDMRPELSVEEIIQQSESAVLLLKRPDGQGSGFLITDTGVIATNAHVARGVQTLVAILPTGEEAEANVVYIDPELDIALAKVEGSGLHHLSLADLTTVRQGQTVVAIGNPGRGLPFSVTKGIVSAIGPKPEFGPGIWVQTDAAINPGNSGGPLLNGHGEVVGINTRRIVEAGFQSIGFALSSTDLMTVLRRFYPSVIPQASQATQSAGGTGSLNIAVDPDGADVYIDGRYVGNAPAALRLPAGQHTIQLKSEGHADWQRSIEVLKDSEVSIKAQLAAIK